MTFFNKKEEVIEIELTQYGKYLLSKGKFKPFYYTFSDDEVLYDNTYAASDDAYAGETHERIQNTTPRLRTIYEHDGAESRVLTLNGHQVTARKGDFTGTRGGLVNETPVDQLYSEDTVDMIRMGADDRNLVRNLIGTSEIANQNSPAWQVLSLNDEEFANPVQMSSSSPNIGYRVPILEMDLDYKMKKLPLVENVTANYYKTQSPDQAEIAFMDNVVISIDQGTILLEIEEENVSDKKSNFDVEFFIVDSTTDHVRESGTITEEILKQLFIREEFREPPDKVDNLETYLEVLVDDEILIGVNPAIGPENIYDFDQEFDEGLCD